MMATFPQFKAARQVGIVPHTHWDREWYAPFQVSRLQLVHLVDELLDLLEADPSYARFLLDGQTAVLDDYLEVRPDAADRIAALVARGRLQIGPWMVLMDEFMVSGETIVRDLQLGLARGGDLGGAMPVGYLPDMFGHVAQMPQILRLAGIEHAVVWRGVPGAIDRTAFWWEAPNGSRVRAEYLYGSYANGEQLPSDARELVARTRNYELELGSAELTDGGVLLMNGADHVPPQPELGRAVAEANAIQDRYEFTIASLPEYLDAQPSVGIPTWWGELRSGARANLLMGVASNRVDVHQSAAAAERALERRAEPLSALFLSPARYPDVLLGLGWRNVVLNSAHDSACACSHDEVVEAVRVRYEEARHIGEALADDALRALAHDIDAPPSSTVVVNATAAERPGVVTADVPTTGPVHFVSIDDGTPRPTQVIGTRTRQGLSTVVTGQKIRWVLNRMRGREFAGMRVARVERHERIDGSIEYAFHEATPGYVGIDLESTRDELLALGESGATIAVRQHRAPTAEVAFAAGPVAGFGWRAYRTAAGDGPSTRVAAHGTVLVNEHLRVEVDPSDGTCSIGADGVAIVGANRYVDGGDGGDTYNFSPPDLDRVVDRPESVCVAVVEAGPVRARLAVSARYRLPTHAIGDQRSCARRSDDAVPVDIRTVLELRTGERFLRVRVELDHRVRDHRLRAHFPLPRSVSGSDAECAFAVVHRGLTAEGSPAEFGLPTFVSRRFVDCSDGDVGLALLHDGLLEYEVVEHGTELALTLLRATGYLSRGEPAFRPSPAGPLDRLEGPQLQRPLALEYAVLPHRGDWGDADVHQAADDFLVPLERVHATGAPEPRFPPCGHGVTVLGAQVSALVREHAGAPLTLRLYNPRPLATVATVMLADDPAGGHVVDFTGREVARFTQSVELSPWQIVTLRLD
jgi:alpha-mannosidase